MKLYNGDCLEVMKEFPDNSIDFILTDPPYGTTSCKWDFVIPYQPMWKEVKRIRKDNTAIALFGTEPFSSHLRLSNLKEFKYDWYWEKDKGTGQGFSRKQPLRKIELIHLFYKKQPTYNWKGKKLDKPYKHTLPIIQNGSYAGSTNNLNPDGTRKYKTYTHKTKTNNIYFARDNQKQKSKHPTQKPVALLEYLIKTYTKENETILDFTMGSGSTGVACVNTNRDFIGIELDKEYFKIAKARINNETLSR